MTRRLNRSLGIWVVLGAWFVLGACSSGGGGETLDVGEDQIADGTTDVPLDILEDNQVDAEEDGAVDNVEPDAVEDLGEDLEDEIVPDVEEEIVYPDPEFIHEVESEAVASAATQFQADLPTVYRTVDKLPVLDIRSLEYAGNYIWAGTANGLYFYEELEDLFKPLTLDGLAEGPVVALARRGETPAEDLAIVQSDRLLIRDLLTTDTEVYTTDGSVEFTGVALCGEDVWLGTVGDGLWQLTFLEGEWTLAPVVGASGEGWLTIRALDCTEDGRVWMATEDGLRIWDGSVVGEMRAEDTFPALPDNDVRDLLVNHTTNYIWALTKTGVSRLDGVYSEFMLPGIDMLPAADNRNFYLANDWLLIGHDIGATAVEEPLMNNKLFKRFDHYTSHRWLPNNQVVAVVVDEQNRFWLGTPEGISRIEWTPQSLTQKAAFHEELLLDHFWRMGGFVSSDASVDDAWNWLEGAFHLGDKDNDGLWTEMQIGAWCYAYSVTGEEAYYNRARKAMDNMFMLVDLPVQTFEEAGMEPGYCARSLVKDDEGTVFESKATQSNWHLVEWEGSQYYWKDDTSSDEYAGHFYGYPLFYDLCAKTDSEKKELADRAALMMTYIMDGGWVLKGLNGEATTHGHWEPEEIAVAWEGFDKCVEEAATHTDWADYVSRCGTSWGGGGWLNSLEIMGALLATYHMTGDTKFYDAYQYLYEDEHYGVVAQPHEETYTITSPAIMNHSDHELAMLAYQTIIRYEPNDDRRATWINGLQFLYDHEKEERNPLWAGFMAIAAGVAATEMGDALQSLQEMPNDRREWLVDTSYRLDADSWPDDRHGGKQWNRVFAYDEIRTIWWNGSFYEKTDGGSGQGISGPMAYLLPYWALRYSGALSD